MTHAIALNGQWDGLRAFPRAARTHSHRKRLESGLERLGGLYEQMAARAAMLNAGLERLNGLRASLIDQLDASDTDADLEADGSDEPSLCGLGMNLAAIALDDLEDQCEDEGGQCEDEGADESDTSADDHGEPSLGWGLCANQRWLESSPSDLEAEHDGREPPEDDEPDSDAEPDQDSDCAWPEEGDQTTLPVGGVFRMRAQPESHPMAAALAKRTDAQFVQQGWRMAFRPLTKSNVGPFVYLVGPGLPAFAVARL